MATTAILCKVTDMRSQCVAVIVAVFALTGCGKIRPVSVDQVRVKPVTAPDLVALVREPGSNAVLVNVWATWCGPCREEFPDLVKLAQKYRNRGLRVLFVSADFDTELANVKKFLADQGVDFQTFIKAQKDMEFINGLDTRWSGALPATFVYDSAGKLRDFWEGKAEYRTFEQKVLAALSKEPAGKTETKTGGER